MEELTQDVMRRAIQRCISNPNYQVAILCEAAALIPAVKYMFETEKDFLWYEPYIQRMIITHIEFEVRFINGSWIRAFKAAQSSRGIKAHEVDFYGLLGEETLYTILAPMEIEYDAEREREWFERSKLAHESD